MLVGATLRIYGGLDMQLADSGPAVDKILVAYDHSDASQAALRWAIDYSESRDVDLLLVYVVSSLDEWELAAIQVDPDPIRHNIQRLLAGEWSEPLRVAGVTFETRVLVGRPADAILHCAEQENAAMVVLGMTNRGTLFELVAGGTRGRLLHHAHRPVVAVPVGWTRE
jgi:nucleotide-binding universal stress UspA family protein